MSLHRCGFAAALCLLLAACAPKPAICPACPPAQLPAQPPTAGPSGGEKCVFRPMAEPASEARAFFREAEAKLLRLWSQAERTAWVKMTYITPDTEALEVRAQEELMAYTGRKAAEAVCRFGPQKQQLPPDLQRKLTLLRVSLSLPSPRDPARRQELARIDSEMEGAYGRGKYCPQRLQGKCLDLGELKNILAKSRDYDELLDAWVGWRTISPPLRPAFTRLVELANEGARDLGFADLGQLWRSRYDMSPDALEQEMKRLWQQVRPLYQDLHCHVRAALQRQYGKQRIPDGGPIPAHLLGNMWSQDWGSLMELVAPSRDPGGADLTAALAERKLDPVGMVKYAERFFVSLGLPPLPRTFWERSMLEKPRDRDVVCHAYAFDVDMDEDLRIKMCVQITGDDFATIHHELGHNYYYRAYRGQDPLFRDSANPGFHEGLGDTISLSVTPAYLARVGLLQGKPADPLNTLMRRALEKVAFMPFGLLMDRYRWEIFAGRIGPDQYNRAWWQLRRRYQGIEAPVPRSERDFDPGCKYHVAANYPYARYFLAHVLQFQFHRALCRVAGHEGPLHTCSIYENQEAGKRLAAMMAMGTSRPWPEALRALTGEEKMDAGALLEYFQPLQVWLREQNKSRKCGW